ncbi:hypothetical protein GCM10027093_11330 [Paraburkholderia jirisanensis]
MPVKISLTLVYRRNYPASVPETAGNLDWRPELHMADNRRPAVFFRPLTAHHLQWSGLGEGALAHAGFRMRRYANLVMCPATPIGVGGWVLKPAYGGRIMVRQATARPEQSESLSTIVRKALRTAALAPDLAAALDVAGAALIDIAQLARDDHPAQREQPSVREIFCTIQRTADETLSVLERAACIFAAIERLTRDTDEPVNELALIGRSLVSDQSEVLDAAFTSIAHSMSRTEACHG